MDLKIGDRIQVNREGFPDHGRTGKISRNVIGVWEVELDEGTEIDPLSQEEKKQTYLYKSDKLIKLESSNDTAASGDGE